MSPPRIVVPTTNYAGDESHDVDVDADKVKLVIGTTASDLMNMSNTMDTPGSASTPAYIASPVHMKQAGGGGGMS
jgi:hypothetical protein